jgi:hypothetical protein
MVLACCAIIAVPVGFWLRGRRWRAELDEEIAAIRDAGQPLTWEEVLSARDVPPDYENATLVLMEVFAEDLGPAEGEGTELACDLMCADGSAPSPQALAMAGCHVSDHQAVLDAIDQASELPGASYPIPAYTSPLDLVVPELPAFRKAQMLCGTAAALSAARGDPDGAAASLVRGAQVLRSLGDCPTLIHFLMRAGSASLWVAAVEQSLMLTELPPDALTDLRGAVAAERRSQDLRMAFYAERAMGYSAISGEVPGAGGLRDPRHRTPGWVKEDELLHISHVSDMIEALDLPVHERIDRADALQSRLEERIMAHPRRYVGSAMLLPVLPEVIAEQVRVEALLTAAEVGLAVEQWRMAHGDWPESLDPLVPALLAELPPDPFTGRPLQYTVADDTAIVYSVGADLQDDGGTSLRAAQRAAELKEPYGTAERWDESFALLRPELRGARQRTFAEEVELLELDSWRLEGAGFTPERLRELGFSEEDLQRSGTGESPGAQ